MDYYEIHFTRTSSTADAAEPVEPTVINDLLAAELGEIAFDGFMSDDEGLLAYIPVDLYHAEALEQRLRNFPLADVRFHYTQTVIKDRDWNEVWEKNYFQPVRIGDQCVVRAPFHPHETGFAHEIIIHPKMAFGTGNHETTYLMLCEILAMDLAGSEVLDMGCGTAVLSILAARKGAARIVAIDVDEWAYRNAAENCLLNQVEHIRIIHGGAEKIPSGSAFDAIFANINRNILLNDLHRYVAALKTGGALCMSGFYRGDLPAMEDACRQNGLALVSCGERNDWSVIKTKKT